jgi:molybdopterin-guanine dinucleotide biosynthesis protein A
VIDVLVLAGGAGRRLGGPAKPTLTVGGRRLIDRVLAALADHRAVVVGDVEGLPPGVGRVIEEPPGAGPAAAVAAGLAACRRPGGSDLVGLFAADLAFLTPDAVAQLISAATSLAGALFDDDTGRPQWLCSVWPAGLLYGRVSAEPAIAGSALRTLLADVPATHLTSRTVPPPWYDCDTEDALAQAREWAEDR